MRWVASAHEIDEVHLARIHRLLPRRWRDTRRRECSKNFRVRNRFLSERIHCAGVRMRRCRVARGACDMRPVTENTQHSIALRRLHRKAAWNDDGSTRRIVAPEEGAVAPDDGALSRPGGHWYHMVSMLVRLDARRARGANHTSRAAHSKRTRSKKKTMSLEYCIEMIEV
eukprot:5817345-Prymnesium_polylepis.2